MFRGFAFGVPVGDRCGHGGRGRRGWWSWDSSEFWMPHGRHRRARMGRVFEQGDLKFVILRLLEEKPRHGYEIIKELEDRFGGAYSPSPGTVYPTLTMLEDLGYAKATPDEGGKKTYSITAEGSAYLKEHGATVDSIFDRISQFMEGFLDAPMMEVNNAFRQVTKNTFMQASRNVNDRPRLEKIREVLLRAAAELEKIEKDAAGGGSKGGG